MLGFLVFMKFNAVVHRFILREILAPFILSVSLLLFVFLMTNMLKVTDLVVNYRVGLGTVLQIMLFLIPTFLIFIIPMSAMTAILLAFLKMSNDNEITALKAGGISLYHLMPPVLLFCVMTFFIASFMTVLGQPWGKNAVKEMLINLNASSYNALLKERTFNDSFKGIMIYVNKTDPKTKALIDVFVEDRNNRGTVVTITAPKGQLVDSPENDTFHLRLYNGFINQVQLKDKSSHGIRFETYDVRLDLSGARSAARGMMKRESEMSFAELRSYLNKSDGKDERYFAVLLELHKKFSLPFACITLGIIAVPLGIQSKSTKRSFGIGLALVLFLVYYLMFSAGVVLGESGIYPPVVGMWAPNLVMGGLGLFLLIRSANERSLLLANFIEWIANRHRKQNDISCQMNTGDHPRSTGKR
jgi:lipopolysaccharide export system permease protein